MSSSTDAIIEIDVRGEVCPFPMMKAVEHMKKAQAGEIINMLIDDPAALDNIPVQAKRLGWEWEVEQMSSPDPEWRMTLRRKA